MAILVDQNCPPIWRLNTKLYKGVWNVSANNSETVGYKDLRLGQIVYIVVFYNISFSWPLPLDCFYFFLFAMFIAWHENEEFNRLCFCCCCRCCQDVHTWTLNQMYPCLWNHDPVLSIVTLSVFWLTWTGRVVLPTILKCVWLMQTNWPEENTENHLMLTCKF